MIIDIDLKNVVEQEKLILNIKKDGHIMIHKNLDNVLSIKDELLKVISDLEWSK
jgi:hypothetical protein